MEPLSESAIRSALKAAFGNAACAARQLGVRRGQLIKQIASNPNLRTILDDYRSEMVDNAESALHVAVANKAPWAARFVATTLGRNRGFGEPDPPDYRPASEPEPEQELGQLTPEQTERFHYLHALVHGGSDGVMPPQPEFVQRLDAMGKPGGVAGPTVEDVLLDTKGHLACTAAMLNVTRGELTGYLAARPDVQAVLVDIREELVDNAETVIRVAIAKQKPWAISFAIKMLAKKRGVSDRPQRYDPRDQPKPAGIQPDFTKFTREQFQEFQGLLDIMLHRTEAISKYESELEEDEDLLDG